MLDLPRAPDLRKLSKRVNVIGAAPAPIRTRTPRRVRGRIRVHVNVILRRNDARGSRYITGFVYLYTALALALYYYSATRRKAELFFVAQSC